MSSQRETFAHFDRIAASEVGSVLMVCEPIMASAAGRIIELQPGSWLRVIVKALIPNGIGMSAQVAIDGRVVDVWIGTSDFTLLEPKE